MALDLSMRLGLIKVTDLDRATALIAAAGLPISAPADLPDTETILALMGMDKKVLNGQLRLVLLRNIGDAYISNDFDANLLTQTLQHYL